MPKPLDTALQMSEVAMQVGGLALKCWQAEKTIRVLEDRVAELEARYEPPATLPSE